MKKKNEKNIETESVKQVKQKKSRRIHILDVTIVLLIIAICVGLFFRQEVVDMFGNFRNLEEAEVSFSVKNISDKTRYNIYIGDEVYFKTDRNVFGTIMETSENSEIALIVVPASETFVENGTSITVNYPPETRINANGKIKCKGYFAEDGSFMINGSTYIAAGQSMVVCTEKVTLQINITGITAK